MFELIPQDWAKRRTHIKREKPVAIQVFDYKQINNHFCTIIVHFEDGSSKELLSRVVQNHITKTWVVDGMEYSVRVTYNGD